MAFQEIKEDYFGVMLSVEELRSAWKMMCCYIFKNEDLQGFYPIIKKIIEKNTKWRNLFFDFFILSTQQQIK